MKDISDLFSLIIKDKRKKLSMVEMLERPDGELLEIINQVEVIRASEEIILWCSTCLVMVAKGFDLETSKGKARDHKHGRAVINRWD